MPTPDDPTEPDTSLPEWDEADLSYLEATLRSVHRRAVAEPPLEMLVAYLCGALSIEQAPLLERRLARDPASRARLREVGAFLDRFQDRPLAALLTQLTERSGEAEILHAFLTTILSRMAHDSLARALALLREPEARRMREEASGRDGEAVDARRRLQSALPGLMFDPAVSSPVSLARGAATASAEDDEILTEWFERRLQEGHILTFQGKANRAPAFVRALGIPRRGLGDTLLIDLMIPEPLRRVAPGGVLRLMLVFPPSAPPEDTEADPTFVLTLGEWPLDTWDSDAPRTVSLAWMARLAVPSIAFLRALLLVPDITPTS